MWWIRGWWGFVCSVMMPSIERIRKTRALVMWGVRLVGGVLLLLGLYLLVKQLAFGLMIGRMPTAWRYYSGVGNWHHGAHGAAALVVGLPLMVFSRWIARFVVAMPDRECPGCGYTGERDDKGRCPECGVELPGVG